MENEKRDSDENLFTRDNENDFSSGPLTTSPDDDDQNRGEDENEAAADDELDDDL